MKNLSYNPQITVNQHYVPSQFLSAWCNDGLLWVSNKGLNIFQQKPQNVAKTKGIYSYEYMTSKEFIESVSDIENLAKGLNTELLKVIMDGMVSRVLYREICDGRLTQEDFERIISFVNAKNLCTKAEILLLKMLWFLYKSGNISEEVNHFCRKYFIEGLEPFITRIEQIAYPLIESLRRNELMFLDDLEKRESLLLYISVQIFRVKKFTDLSERYGFINSKTLKLARPIFIAHTVNFLMRNWGNEEFFLVENSTDLEFITGDNPICNLDAHDKSKFLDLYFPISPSKAVFICDKDRVMLYPEMNRPTIQDVHNLNRKICGNSISQVFAKNRDTLHFGGYKPTLNQNL